MGCEIWKSPYRSFHQTAIPLVQKLWKYHHSGESQWQWMKLPRHQTLVSRMIKRKENLELYHLVNPTFSSFNLTFFHFLHLQPSNLLQENTILLLTEDTVSIIIKHPFDYNIYIYIYIHIFKYFTEQVGRQNLIIVKQSTNSTMQESLKKG